MIKLGQLKKRAEAIHEFLSLPLSIQHSILLSSPTVKWGEKKTWYLTLSAVIPNEMVMHKEKLWENGWGVVVWSDTADEIWFWGNSNSDVWDGNCGEYHGAAGTAATPRVPDSATGSMTTRTSACRSWIAGMRGCLKQRLIFG